jgi:phosphoglycerate dehydrogenase-like enzyme
MATTPIKIVLAGHHFLSVTDYIGQSLPGAQIIRVGEDELLGSLEDTDVLVPSMCKIDCEILAAAPRLRLVQQWGAGLDMVDREAATRLGIAVANVPTEGTGNAESVAEWCVMAVIAISRGLLSLNKQIAQGGPWGSPYGQALMGKTAGIVGLGGIGKALASRLKPFKMHIVGVKRNPQDFDNEEYGLDWVGGMDSLPELLKISDYVFLCLPLVKETWELIGSRELALMPRGAYLINIGRGPLVNRKALFEAIENEHLGGAALDVFWQEPVSPADSDLIRPQVLATPHIAGVTDISYYSIAAKVAENIQRVMNGQLPLNCANPDVGFTPEWKTRTESSKTSIS